ncbi:hypothetical protein V5799_016777 [Amblyomma americanum]|uniref:Uncharacterized protein n=1 Tax=Amblyomma americanum TaxID=6943 RepID=A0AAQ4F432_AMBAM
MFLLSSRRLLEHLERSAPTEHHLGATGTPLARAASSANDDAEQRGSVLDSKKEARVTPPSTKLYSQKGHEQDVATNAAGSMRRPANQWGIKR